MTHIIIIEQGKKVWTIKLPASITTMETMDYSSKGFKGVIVALNNCQVHLYKEKYLVNVITTEDIATGLKFGRFGREDATLVMTTRGKYVRLTYNKTDGAPFYFSHI